MSEERLTSVANAPLVGWWTVITFATLILFEFLAVMLADVVFKWLERRADRRQALHALEDSALELNDPAALAHLRELKHRRELEQLRRDAHRRVIDAQKRQ